MRTLIGAALVAGLAIAGSAAMAQAGGSGPTTAMATPTDERVPATRSVHRTGALTVEVRDLTPRFLDFYARAEGQDADARFATWQARYGFAAVPPGPQGDAMRRPLLDAAWPRYAAALPTIRGGFARRLPIVLPLIERTAQVLGFTQPLTLRLTGYVGGFENNAFAAIGPDGVTTIALPIEADDDFYTRVVPHEAGHAFHGALAGFAPGYERTLASLIVTEGLAMHLSRVVTPGRPDSAYTQYRPGWHDEMLRKRCAILRGVVPYLELRDQPTLARFTLGSGTQGLEREAYAAGWHLIGAMMAKGRSLREIARLPEADLPATLRNEISRITECRRDGVATGGRR